MPSGTHTLSSLSQILDACQIYYQPSDWDTPKESSNTPKVWNPDDNKEMNHNSSHLMEVEVLRMLRYCRMSGTVINRNARRNRSPGVNFWFLNKINLIALMLIFPIFSSIILTNPCSVQVYGDEGRRNGEVVDEGVNFKHEPELVRGSNELGKPQSMRNRFQNNYMIYNLRGHPDEEVDHEENVEGEVDLLCRVLYPRSAGFYTIPENRE